jgi:hypothetical protein
MRVLRVPASENSTVARLTCPPDQRTAECDTLSLRKNADEEMAAA